MICEEMQLFREALDARGVEWVDRSDYGGQPITRTHFVVDGQKWSVINGYGTYGGYIPGLYENRGLLEVYALESNEEETGWLTAAEAIKIIFGAEART